MPDPEKGYIPSPAEIRAAEASMSDIQREHTETREDAFFEGKRQAAEGQNSEVVEESQNEARESAGVDYVEQYKHLKESGIYQDAEGLTVLRSSGEWDGGWYVASMDTLFGRILMKKHEGNEVLTKKFSYDEAEGYIRAGAKTETEAQTPDPTPETPTPVNPELTPVESESIEESAEEIEKTQEQPKNKEEYETRLEVGVKSANTFDELKTALRSYQWPIKIDGIPFQPSTICGYIDGSQDEGRPLEERNRYLDHISNEFGIRDAVIRIMNLLKDEQPRTPEPESPTPASPEAKVEFRNIPLKNGRIISGYVESASASSVLIMTPQGRTEIGRSELLNYNEIYSRGDKTDSDRLMALQQDEARKKREGQERQSRQNDPPAMHMSAGA